VDNRSSQKRVSQNLHETRDALQSERSSMFRSGARKKITDATAGGNSLNEMYQKAAGEWKAFD
jgi:hypothetical protein